jgi:hypothetical protein
MQHRCAASKTKCPGSGLGSNDNDPLSATGPPLKAVGSLAAKYTNQSAQANGILHLATGISPRLFREHVAGGRADLHHTIARITNQGISLRHQNIVGALSCRIKADIRDRTAANLAAFSSASGRFAAAVRGTCNLKNLSPINAVLFGDGFSGVRMKEYDD